MRIGWLSQRSPRRRVYWPKTRHWLRVCQTLPTARDGWEAGGGVSGMLQGASPGAGSALALSTSLRKTSARTELSLRSRAGRAAG